MRLLLLAATLLAAPCFAEAGLPFAFCGVQSCTCGAITCGCGQVCNFSTKQCETGQAGYCSNDSNCAATCDRFICEGNVCVRGVRDGGSNPLPDGGTPPTGNQGNGGCSTAGGSLAFALLAAALRLIRRPASFPKR